MAFANSKTVLIQSAVRGWLVRLRCGLRVHRCCSRNVAAVVDEIYEEWDVVVMNSDQP